MEEAFSQIEEELRTQYVASYTPTNAKLDGTYRKIDMSQGRWPQGADAQRVLCHRARGLRMCIRWRMPQSTSEASELLVLRYPIGGPDRAESFTPQQRSAAIEGIRQLPQSLRSAVAGFSEEQLETPYRPGGWTVRQLVHHVADSHMNAYIRVRLALTEDWPTIKGISGSALG